MGMIMMVVVTRCNSKGVKLRQVKINRLLLLMEHSSKVYYLIPSCLSTIHIIFVCTILYNKLNTLKNHKNNE
ncbi:hypothetical protein Q7M_1341 (plasmid) [Borrelia crocidurae str. Achema]|uniref:Uncharacterized protein n=1 Tax=Borrelia crocidurae (strain Achema) TaxID=1155096 RepID=I0FF41_BORCA|nr:hypothetical protein Q7M_1341 [Borrelia crocidurae str. Achema]